MTTSRPSNNTFDNASSDTACNGVSIWRREAHGGEGGTAVVVRSEMTDVEGMKSPPVKRRKSCRGLPSTLKNGRRDWETVRGQGKIPRQKFSRRKGDDEKIRHVIKYMIQPEATQLLAWRTIRLYFGADWKVFPGIVHRVSVEDIRRYYRERPGIQKGARRDP